jgi:hypothetical protein
MSTQVKAPVTFVVTPSVHIEGSRYVVSIGDLLHLVSKNRTCNCGQPKCMAIGLVEDYLRHGGRRAQDTKSPCPICGEETVRDVSVSTRRTRGWTCTSGGLDHFWKAHLQSRKWVFPPGPGYPGLPVSDFDIARQISEESHARWAGEGYDPSA